MLCTMMMLSIQVTVFEFTNTCTNRETFCQTHEHSPKFPCYVTHIAAYSTCTCTCIYMQLVIVQWNFFEFNVLEGYSALYGAYSWHWWVSRLLTVFIAGSKLVNGISVGWFECNTQCHVYAPMYMYILVSRCLCVCFCVTHAWHFCVLFCYV